MFLTGAGRAFSNIGNCAFRVDSTMEVDSLIQFQANSDIGGLTYVTDPLAAGSHGFSITCNEIVAPFQLVDAKLAAVMIGDA